MSVYKDYNFNHLASYGERNTQRRGTQIIMGSLIAVSAVTLGITDALSSPRDATMNGEITRKNSSSTKPFSVTASAVPVVPSVAAPASDKAAAGSTKALQTVVTAMSTSVKASVATPNTELATSQTLSPLVTGILVSKRAMVNKAAKHVQKRMDPILREYAGGHWEQVTVRPGDSFVAILKRLNVYKPSTWSKIRSASGQRKYVRRLTNLRPGEKLVAKVNNSGDLLGLRYNLDLERQLNIKKTKAGFISIVETLPIERRVQTASGIVEGSLFLSAQRAGLTDKLTMNYAQIFAWDVDFALDIRPGDRFKVVYEELYRDGEKVKDGRILAAQFTSRSKDLTAVHYTLPDGKSNYYTPKGRSMRKAFSRNPVDFVRISSKFNLKRRHPVLNRIRAHKGVDYAARKGTPIKTVGNGKIAFKGWQRGYGQTVVVDHGRGYKTLYAHMSRFGRGMKKGKRVTQGTVIGYVGKTGLATGNHLHYEFRVRGRHVNPLTVALPKAPPLPRRYMSDFKQRAAGYMTVLASLNNAKVAQNGDALGN